MTEFRFDKPLFIDSCAIGLLHDPHLFKFWKRFGNDVRHCISPVVYWEYLRGCGPKMHRRPNRDDFIYWAAHNAEMLPFNVKEAEHATAIYHGLEQKLKDVPKTEKRERLRTLHADIIIASSAVQRGLQVLTADLKDWTDIWAVIREGNVGPLGGFAVVDPKDIPA